jgi:predicted nuclease of predicted toxin-antitoxin system
MTVIVDAQLSPLIARWLANRFGVEATHVSEAGQLHASDRDFVEIVRLSGPPPRVIWVTRGNTSNRRVAVNLEKTFEQALQMPKSGESLVEIKG